LATGFGQLGGYIAWGGGHNGYFGNELYVFDIAQRRWVRYTEPVQNPVCNQTTGELQNGTPCSRHTYDYVDYHPRTNSFISLGSASNHEFGGGGSPRVHMFSFDTNRWRAGAENYANFLSFTGASSAYDVNRDVFWLMSSYARPFAKYDPNANSGNGNWTQYPNSSDVDIDTVSSIDPTRDLFVAVDTNSRDRVLVIDLKNPSAPRLQVNTIGDKTLEGGHRPGFEWDPVVKKFVGWDGGTSVYTLTPPNGDWRTQPWVWNRVDAAANNTVTPSAPNRNGTYSRWQYVPSINAYVIVSHVDAPVYVYKLSAQAGDGANNNLPTPPPVPPVPPPASAPVINQFSATPSTIDAGQSSNLSWNTSNATSCTAQGSWAGTRNLQGTMNVTPLANSAYTLTCNGAGGSASRTVNITVNAVAPPPPAPTLTLSSNPGTVTAGEVSTLRWSSTNASRCEAMGSWSGTRNLQGNRNVTPPATSTYRLTCSGAGGSISAQTTVTVNVAQNSPPNQPVIADPGIVTLQGQRIEISGQYNDPDGDTFRAAQWQIATSQAFNALILEREIAARTALTIPTGLLKADSTYWVRTRHKDAQGLLSNWSAPVSFASEAQATNDADNNGIDDNYQVNGFTDTNNNGTNDQDEGVCNLLGEDQSQAIGIQSASGISQCNTVITAAEYNSVLASNGKSPIYGLFGFNITGLTPGDAAQVTLFLPQALPADSRWFQYDQATGQTIDLTSAATIRNDQVVLRLVDGGLGDLDGTANGIIVDPSGPVANATTSGGGSSSTVAPSESGGGGAFSLWLLLMLLPQIWLRNFTR
jgi:hypothetical protein